MIKIDSMPTALSEELLTLSFLFAECPWKKHVTNFLFTYLPHNTQYMKVTQKRYTRKFIMNDTIHGFKGVYYLVKQYF